MKYDSNDLMADIDFPSFVEFCISELGYEVKRSDSLDKGSVCCICHYHNDGTKKSSNRFGSTRLIQRGTFKGLKCFACDTSKSLIQMVMDEKDMAYWQAIDFICERFGLIKSSYAIAGTESAWELRNNVTTAVSPLDRMFPDPLTAQELQLIGLSNGYDSSNTNYCVLGLYSDLNKPEIFELEKGESLIKQIVPNPNYVSGSISKYANFMDYVSGIKNLGGSDEDPFITQWLLIKRSVWTLSQMYQEDKETYWKIVTPKITDTILRLEKEKESASKFVKYNIEKQLKILYSLFDKYVNLEIATLLSA